VRDRVTLLSPARIEGRVAATILHLSSAGRQRMGFAERRAEGIWARRFGRQSIQRAGCLFLPVIIWRVL